MATLFTYIKKNKDIPFSKENMTIVDALIFTGIVYLPLPVAPDDDMSDHDSIGNLLNDFINHPTAYQQCVMPLTDLKFARTLVKANRYRNVKMYGYYESINASEEKQFRAVTFVKEDHSQIFISFCGTDTTLVGWKEDFNLAYERQVPSQNLAINYLNHIAQQFPNSDIYVGGHSKGGNLAMYASTYCKADVQNRIKYVFNFDGPGFVEEDLITEEYSHIRNRIISIFPNYSMVGMIFNFSDDYRIIRSFGVGIYNHAFYYWNTKGMNFQYSKRISRLSAKTYVICKRVYNEFSDYEKQIFMDNVYKILTAGGLTTTHGITKNIRQFVEGAASSYQNLDRSTKEKIAEIFLEIASNYLRPMSKIEKQTRKFIEENATRK